MQLKSNKIDMIGGKKNQLKVAYISPKSLSKTANKNIEKGSQKCPKKTEVLSVALSECTQLVLTSAFCLAQKRMATEEGLQS